MKPFILYLFRFIIYLLPETRAFQIKRMLYRLAGVNVGKNVRICSSAKIIGNGTLSIGENTWIGHDVLIISSSDISIGANVDIAPRVYIGTGTHEIDLNTPGIAGKGISKGINIGDGCWLGVGSILLPGVIIGSKCLIAAGAVVKGNFPPYSFIGGVPAQLIRKLL